MFLQLSQQIAMVGLVSVIIPTVKGDKYLDRCIESVKRQSYKDIEVIVVDEGLERSVQRNIGVKRAIGEWLLFLDSDMVLHPLVIEDCVLYGMSCYIPERVVGDKVRNFERQFYTGTCIDATRFVYNCTVPLPRFDEEMSGPEDWDFSRYWPGYRVCKFPLYHLGTHSLERKAYYMKSINKYIEKWGWDDTTKRQLSWQRVFLFIEKGKWIRLIRHPILTIRMIKSLWQRYRLLSQHLS